MKPLVAVYVPTFGRVSIQWANARAELQLPLGGSAAFAFDASNKNIAEKRNTAVLWAREAGARYLFFLGDDILAPGNTLIKMLRLQTLGYRVITGLYFSRSIPVQPMIFNDPLQGPDWDWHIGDLKQVQLSGCDCLMVEMKVFDEIEPPWFSLDYKMCEGIKLPPLSPEDKSGVQAGGTRGALTLTTEDFYFYTKLKETGIAAWCDTSIQCGHQDRESLINYELPPDYPQAKPGSEIPRKQERLIADIGAGLRSDPLHLTGDVVRFDIDPGKNPDVLCDVLLVPEPDCKFDLVLASHILEHIAMEKAVGALREWVRILKVGGELVIRVPNVAFAMEKIIAGTYHPYHWQMIYGLQNAVGEFHQNGFTRGTLLKLAEMFRDWLKNFDVEYTGPQGEWSESEITLKALKYSHYECPVLWLDKENNDK